MWEVNGAVRGVDRIIYVVSKEGTVVYGEEDSVVSEGLYTDSEEAYETREAIEGRCMG